MFYLIFKVCVDMFLTVLMFAVITWKIHAVIGSHSWSVHAIVLGLAYLFLGALLLLHTFTDITHLFAAINMQ